MNTYKGLIQKYIIRRTDGKPIDPDNKYFVLKYEGDDDEKHIEACRKALRVYAEEVKDFLPELSEDLFRKLGRTPISPSPLTREELIEKATVFYLKEYRPIPDDFKVLELMADFALSLNLPIREVTDEEIRAWHQATFFNKPNTPVIEQLYALRDLLTKKGE